MLKILKRLIPKSALERRDVSARGDAESFDFMVNVSSWKLKAGELNYDLKPGSKVKIRAEGSDISVIVNELERKRV